MSDKPVVGQIGRPDRTQIQKLEIIGKLRPPEWRLFIACLRDCARKFGGKIRIRPQGYAVNLTKIFAEKSGPSRRKATKRSRRRR